MLPKWFGKVVPQVRFPEFAEALLAENSE